VNLAARNVGIWWIRIGRILCYVHSAKKQQTTNGSACRFAAGM